MAYEGSKLEYNASVASQSMNDTAKLSISEDGVAVTTLFTPLFIDFADIVSFERRGYSVVIETEYDRFTFSGLGNLMEAFYLELYATFNRKVLKALFAKGDAAFEAEGEFRYSEPGAQAVGYARIRVYDDCVCLLPPDNRARRIPFAFMNGLQKAGFTLTLSLDGGELYSFIRLGNNTAAFESCIREKLHHLRENAVDAARKLDGGLNPAQLNAIAARMPQGVAAPIGWLALTAPSYVAALEAKIGESRAAETYAAFKEICDPAQICVGMKSWLAGEQQEDIPWFIAPSPGKPVAAVELALDEDTAAATYMYNTVGSSDAFARLLNRAMEDVNFHREVISTPAEKLRGAENGVYAMTVKCSAALRAVRACFAGRVIHSSPDAWKAEMLRFLR